MNKLITSYRGYKGHWTREGELMKGVFFNEDEKLCVGGSSVFEDSQEWRDNTNKTIKAAIDADIEKHKGTRFVGFVTTSTPVRAPIIHHKVRA